MRRRTLLAAAALGAPVQLLTTLDDVLAGMPEPTGSTVPLHARTARARTLFDAGNYSDLLRVLPGLLADAHAAARTRSEPAHALLSACYTLAAQLLIKIGKYDRARLTADRAQVYADISGSSLASAAAARELGIVLRHQEQPEAAQRLILRTADKVRAAGLAAPAQVAAYAQMLCTTAYTAARAGDREQALGTIGEASGVVRSLPAKAAHSRLFPLTPAAVELYTVGVHWALGDAGAAVHAGRRLHEGRFSTAERKGRMYTDLARAWWQWGKAEQTADTLLAAQHVAPAEVRDRPAIRQIVSELHVRHPRVSGVRQLAEATGLRA